MIFLTFTNLVEAHVLAGMRRKDQVQLKVIRKATRFVEEQLGVPQPLARETFQTDGVDLFVERFGQLINASQDGLIEIRDGIRAQLKRIEYKDGRALRLFPVIWGSADVAPRVITVDPRMAFGQLTIVDTGIPVDTLISRWRGGEPMRTIAADFDLGVDEVEEALRATGILLAA